jgi:AraC-like DNA-binding protein
MRCLKGKDLDSFNKYKSEKAVQVLIANIDAIPNVQSWALKVKVSRGWLCKAMKENYEKTPNEIIREVRYEKMIQVLGSDIEATCYCVARDSGLPTGDSMRMFLKRYKGTNFRKLRRNILSDNLDVEWQWLEGA